MEASMEPIKTVFGEEPDPEVIDDWWVPEEERLEEDGGPESDALDDETGDDMADWKPK